jgi:ribosomal protein L14
MIQKNSIIKPSDSCGVIKSKIFHVYKGSKGKLAFVGDFLKSSARLVKPENPIKKKSKSRAFLLRTVFRVKRMDDSIISFKKNSIILLKKRLTPKGKSIRGPVLRVIKRKKFISSFKKSL